MLDALPPAVAILIIVFVIAFWVAIITLVFKAPYYMHRQEKRLQELVETAQHALNLQKIQRHEQQSEQRPENVTDDDKFREFVDSQR